MKILDEKEYIDKIPDTASKLDRPFLKTFVSK